MAIILIRLHSLDPGLTRRPPACPYCGSFILQSWGSSSRAVFDTRQQEFQTHRYRCTECQHTFRIHPNEVDQNHQTKRIRHLAVVLWSAGFSFRAIASIFSKNGIPFSHMTLYREAKEILAGIKEQGQQEHLSRYMIDPIFNTNQKRRQGVGIAIDFGGCEPVVIGTINEANPQKVKAWLSIFLKDDEIEILDLSTKELQLPSSL